MTKYDPRFQQHQRRHNSPPRRNSSGPTQQERQQGERIAARLIEHANRYGWTPDVVMRRLAASCQGQAWPPAKQVAASIILCGANSQAKGGQA